MPFISAKQEAWMKINTSVLWHKWVKEYGHAKGTKAKVKRAAKKGARTRKRRVAKRKGRKR